MGIKRKFSKALEIKGSIHEAIYRINVGQDLSEDLAYNAFRQVLLMEDSGSHIGNKHIYMGILLNGVMAKKPTIDEVVGFIKAGFSLDKYDPSNFETINPSSNRKIVGVAGSGKKGIKTINISTISSIVAATCGVCVAKPCSSATSSNTGSSDFVESVGAVINCSNKKMIKTMFKTNIGFFKIENIIPNFDKHYGGLFFAPHVLSFGFAGLMLPFRPNSMLYGLSHPNVSLVAKVMREFKWKDVFVATTTDDGIHFLDELGVFGTSFVVGVKNGKLGNVAHLQIAETLNLPKYCRDSISPGITREENIKFALNVLKGMGGGAKEDIVCVNAGTILYLAGIVKNLEEGYKKTKDVLKSGYSYKKLLDFIEETGGRPAKILFDK